MRTKVLRAEEAVARVAAFEAKAAEKAASKSAREAAKASAPKAAE